MTVCMNPGCKTDNKPREIKDGDRLVSVGVSINWGDDDLRADWAGDYTFHSFGCLSDWAAEKAADHDGRVLREGA